MWLHVVLVFSAVTVLGGHVATCSLGIFCNGILWTGKLVGSQCNGWNRFKDFHVCEKDRLCRQRPNQNILAKSASLVRTANPDVISQIDMESAHNMKEKAKARKSGPSLCSKTKDLGVLANVFAMAAYWDPTHLCYRVQVHLPEGEELPDINELAEEMLSEASSQMQSQSRRRRPSRSQQQHARRNANIALTRARRSRESSQRRSRESLQRRSRESSQSSIEVIDPRDTDASIDETSFDCISESETYESENVTSNLTIKAATLEEKPSKIAVIEQQQLSRAKTVVKEQYEPSRAPREIANKVPVSNDAQNHYQSSQSSDILQSTDDLDDSWDNLVGDFDFGYDKEYSTSSPREFSFEKCATGNHSERSIFESATKLPELSSGPAELTLLPPLETLKLPHPRVPNKTLRQLLTTIRSLQDALQEYTSDVVTKGRWMPQHKKFTSIDRFHIDGMFNRSTHVGLTPDRKPPHIGFTPNSKPTHIGFTSRTKLPLR